MELLLDYFEKTRMVNCLLFICIFVVHIQADCPRPQGTVNIVLTNDALLKNDFPDGSEATFECANGYVIERGSGVVTCTDGQWTAPELECKKKDCGPPKQQPHMTFEESNDGTLFGASVKVICARGYQVNGATYKQCYASGWGGKVTCEVITCEIPTNITHGRHSWNSHEEPEYGNVIQYSCDGGYSLHGQSFIECSDDGEYDSLPPQCRGSIPTTPISAHFISDKPSSSSFFQTSHQYRPKTRSRASNIEPSTEDIITTTRLMSTTPPTFQGGNDILTKGTTTTDTPVTPTVHKDKTATTTPISTSSPSVQGGKHILTTTDVNIFINTTGKTSATPTQGKVLPNQDSGHTVVIASVIATVLVALILLYMSHWCHTRKGHFSRLKVQDWNS